MQAQVLGDNRNDVAPLLRRSVSRREVGSGKRERFCLVGPFPWSRRTGK